MPSFETLGLRSELLSALHRLHITEMTPVQTQTLPSVMKGKNVIAQAPTGSGKTLAFSLPILHRLNTQNSKIQSLILAPTRELAEQIADVMRNLAVFIPNVKILTLCGGIPMKGQIRSLQHSSPVIVGTPGRVLRLLKDGHMDISECKITVLDEFDKISDMGFIEDVEEILTYLKSPSQYLLFSATTPETLNTFTASFLKDTERFELSQNNVLPNINRRAYVTDDKVTTLIQILTQSEITNAIVFCNTKQAANELFDTLKREEFDCALLHGELEQTERTETLIRFRNGSLTFLIATDLAGRGIDIAGLNAVINYDLPQQAERYVHRIGRTGRAQQEGTAITLIESYQREKFQLLEPDIAPEELPCQSYRPYRASMITLKIDGGKKNKLRAGDIVGAIINELALTQDTIGKIDILDTVAYAAISIDSIPQRMAKHYLKIKGKTFRIRLID